MDELARSADAAGWVEKTPAHIYEIDVMDKYIPQGQFIHILRDGPDVIASIYKASRQNPQRWGRAYTLERCVTFWVDAMAATNRHRHKDNHRIVNYRDLVTKPEVTLHDLCEFLGTEFSETMLDKSEVAAGLAGQDPWHRHITRKLFYRPNETFNSALDPDQRAYVVSAISRAQKSIQ